MEGENTNGIDTTYIRDTLTRLEVSSARLMVRMDNIEQFIRDSKTDVDKIDGRLKELEANKNKIAGIAVAVSVIISIIAPVIRNMLAGG